MNSKRRRVNKHHPCNKRRRRWLSSSYTDRWLSRRWLCRRTQRASQRIDHRFRRRIFAVRQLDCLVTQTVGDVLSLVMTYAGDSVLT